MHYILELIPWVMYLGSMNGGRVPARFRPRPPSHVRDYGGWTVPTLSRIQDGEDEAIERGEGIGLTATGFTAVPRWREHPATPACRISAPSKFPKILDEES